MTDSLRNFNEDMGEGCKVFYEEVLLTRVTITMMS